MNSKTNEVSNQEADIKVTTPEESQPKAEHASTDKNGSQPEEGSKPVTGEVVTGEVVEEEGIAAEVLADEATAEDEADAESTAEVEEEESEESKRIAELETKLATAETRAEELFERLQRTTAEFQNSQRRRERQMQDQMDRANARLIERLLPVLDDFELAFRNMPEEFSGEENGWITGLEQIEKKLRRVLEDEQVTPMELTGEFDPNRHEAVSSEPNEGVESGHIIETLRTGYEYKGRVMRPALVRVAL